MLQGKLPQPHPLKASAIERMASHQDCTRPPAKWATSEMGPLCHANKTTNQGWVLVLHVRWYYWLKPFLGEWLCDKHVKVNIVSRARSKSLKPWSWSGGQLIKWAISNKTITVPVYPKWCICQGATECMRSSKILAYHWARFKVNLQILSDFTGTPRYLILSSRCSSTSFREMKNCVMFVFHPTRKVHGPAKFSAPSDISIMIKHHPPVWSRGCSGCDLFHMFSHLSSQTGMRPPTRNKFDKSPLKPIQTRSTSWTFHASGEIIIMHSYFSPCESPFLTWFSMILAFFLA